MAHDLVVLPSKFIGYGSVVGPGHRTAVQELDSGLEPNRVVRWPQDRRRFDITNEIRIADAVELQEFVIARRGAQNSFLLVDPSDFSTNADHAGAVDDEDQTIGNGDGSTTEFQLKKSYGTGSNPKTRIINKPQHETVVVAVNSVAKTEGLHYTVDAQSGRVSFVTPPPNDHAVTAGFLFYVQCRFAESTDSGFAMVWEEFDILRVSAEIIEDRVPVAAGDRHDAFNGTMQFGGGRIITPTADFNISPLFGDGRVLEFRATVDVNIRCPDVQETAGRWTTYPSTTRVAEGGLYFVIINGHTTTTLTLQERYDPGGGFVWRDLLSGSSLPPRKTREVFLDQSGIWRAR